MIFNTYAIIDAMVSFLRVGFGLWVGWLGVVVWVKWGRHASDPEEKKGLEDRSYLLFLLAGLLLLLNFLSWPVFYLLLQSYVTEWPDVMCIYGVTRIGVGSMSISRFLPLLLAFLQVTKPLVVFLSGAWFTLYLVNRRTQTAPLTRRVLLMLLATNLLAVTDAMGEIAYLVIPKKEVFLSQGCCTTVIATRAETDRIVPKDLLGEDSDRHLSAIYYLVNVAMIFAVGLSARLSRRWLSRRWMLVLFIGAMGSILVNIAFLNDVAAPQLLHMPNHHCPYDLVPKSPLSLVPIVLFLMGSFSVGWGCIVGWIGIVPESRPFVSEVVAKLFRVGVFGYGCSLLIMSGQLART